MGMNEAEADELGGLLVRLTGAIEAVTGAEKVYVVAYGELFPHFHLLLSPLLSPFAPPELSPVPASGVLHRADEPHRRRRRGRDCIGYEVLAGLSSCRSPGVTEPKRTPQTG